MAEQKNRATEGRAGRARLVQPVPGQGGPQREGELCGCPPSHDGPLSDVVRLGLELQSLRQAAAAERERQQLEVAEGRQQVQALEAELQQSQQLCARKEQAAAQEARQHRQAASQLEAEVQRLKGLQQRVRKCLCGLPLRGGGGGEAA